MTRISSSFHPIVAPCSVARSLADAGCASPQDRDREYQEIARFRMEKV
jgi:hypothetical protein